jgi:ABC-2 type transport system ATP-binding protein
MITSRPVPAFGPVFAPAASTCLAELRGVHKSYGGRPALRGFDLELSAGEIVVLLGPNGAGKSTAINCITGLRKADAGTVRLLGADPRAARTRRQLGATPQQLDFPPMLRVREIVDLVRAHYAQPLSTAEVLDRFELGRDDSADDALSRRSRSISLARRRHQ